MKTGKILFILATLAIASCSQEQPEAPKTDGGSFALTFTSEKPVLDDPDARTAYDNGEILWSTSGEKLRIGYSNDGVVYDKWYVSSEGVSADGGKTATFTLPASATEGLSGSRHTFYSLYPASAVSSDNLDDAEAVMASVKNPQQPAAASYDAEADILLASSNEYGAVDENTVVALRHKRVVAHGAVTLDFGSSLLAAGEKIQEVIFTTPEGTAVTGDVSLNLLDQSMTPATEVLNSITLSYPDGAGVDVNGKFVVWFSSIPFTVPQGQEFGIKVVTDKTYYTHAIVAREGGIEFKMNCCNTLGIDMSSATRFEDPADYVPVISKIYGSDKHSAFPSLVKFNGAYYCAFREADAHHGNGGIIRIIKSTDGINWENHDELKLFTSVPTSEDGKRLVVKKSASQYIRIPHHTDFDFESNEAFTVTVKGKFGTSGGTIVSTRNGGNNSGYTLAVAARGTGYGLRLDMGPTYYRAWQEENSGATVTLNSLHHAAFVWDGASSTKSMRLHTDGGNGTTVPNADTYVLGNQSNNNGGNDILVFATAGNKDKLETNPHGGNLMDGEIESIRFYNRALSVEEIAADQTSTVTASTPNLIAAYDFSNIQGLTVPDITGKHPATLCNFTRESGDLRDPKLYVTPDNRLMVLMDGEFYTDGEVSSRRPYVSYSDASGNNFSDPVESEVHVAGGALTTQNHWIWSLGWYGGKGYGFDYVNGKYLFFRTEDNGATFSLHKTMSTERATLGNPSETALCFDESGKAYAFIRRNGDTDDASLGYLAVSNPNYTSWTLTPLSYRLEGQNALMYGGDTFLIGTRHFDENGDPQMAVLVTDLDGQLQRKLILTSSGDCSYPGMIIDGNELWVAYYSSHEDNANIYFTKIPLSVLVAE